jgi:ABC-type uncharacterized transport system involved in gliding motility auxiliary subunit
MSQQRIRAASESLGFLGILAAVFVLLNVISIWANDRLDCTGNERFSLSDGSTNLVGELTDHLVITGYFTPDLPPPYNGVERDVRDILAEYEDASSGKLEVRFISPETAEERKAAEDAGILKLPHEDIREDSFSMKEGYRGLVLTYLGRTEVIGAVGGRFGDTAGLEYELTMKIKRLVGERTRVGVLSGHDGPTLAQGLARIQQCMPMYEFVEITANGDLKADDPETDEDDATAVRAVMVVEPHTPLSTEELQHLNRYVMQGGSLGVFGPGVKVNIENQFSAAVQPNDTQINQLLRPWGVVAQSSVVLDPQCRVFMAQTASGMPARLAWPPLPMVTFDEAQQEHPVTFRLNGAMLPFSGPLDPVADPPEGVELTVLASSSDGAWLEAGPEGVPLQPQPPQQCSPEGTCSAPFVCVRGVCTWGPSDETGAFPMLVAIEGELPSAFGSGAASGESSVEAPDKSVRPVRVFVAGSGFLLRDEALGRGGEEECNLGGNNFIFNAVDWLAQDSDLIAVRAKNVEDAPIEVPQNIVHAEEAARAALAEVDSAQQEQIVSALTGMEEEATMAGETAQTATERAEAALAERTAALEEWDAKKAWYRWLNMLGVPVAFAIFGIGWFFYRRSATQRRFFS